MKAFAKLVAVMAMLGCGTLAAQAADIAPADKKALYTYTLSMEKVRGMQAAMDDYEAAAKANPALKKEVDNNEAEDKSLAQAEAIFKAHPDFMVFFARHGLTAHDAVLMPVVLMSAGVAAQYPKAAPKLAGQTSPQQIAFFKAHEKELKAMSWLYGSSDE